MKICTLCFKNINDSLIKNLKLKYISDYLIIEDLYDLDWEKIQNNYRYILILDRLIYTRYDLLINYIKNTSTNLASLKTYWGIGSSDICLINTDMLKDIKNHAQIDKLSTLNSFISQIYCNIIGIKNFDNLLNIQNNTLSKLHKKHKIHNISNNCFSKSMYSFKGYYHNSIFMHYTDDPTIFLNWSKNFIKKQIFFQDKSYNTQLGLNNFIFKKKEICILGKENIVYWSDNQKLWKLIRSNRIIKEIWELIMAKAPEAYEMYKKYDSVQEQQPN